MQKEDYYLRRFKFAQTTADLWIALLEACYHYTVPNRNLYYWTSQYQGAQKNAKVFDTTAVAALKSFVSKIHSALTPPQQDWALLEAGDDVPEEDRERVNRELQELTRTIFSYIHRSNFDLAINECYYDLGIGTACLLVHEGPDEDPLRFYSVPLARLAPEVSYSGLLESTWRWWDEVKIADILAWWPDIKLTPMMQELYRQDPNAAVKILFDGCIDLGPDNPIIKDIKTRYVYVVMWENQLLLEKPMDINPMVTFRWTRINNENMGRGPVIDALPSILSLNELARLELASANFNVSKPIMAFSDGVFNPWTFRLEPNTVIPIAPSINGQWPLQPFPDTSNPNFMQLTSNDLRMQINKLMYADPLGPIEGPNKTATEVAMRQRNLAEEIGPGFTRLQQEFMPRFFENVIGILARKGLIKKVLVNGKEVRIRFKSPLTVSQGQQDIANFTQWFQLMQGIMGPEAALTYINPVKAPAWMAEKMGVDLTVINTTEQMAEFLANESMKAQTNEMAMMENLQNESSGQSIPQLG